MNYSVNNVVAGINHSLEMEWQETISMEELKALLAGYIHHLISNNFNKLISILYRIDISEVKLRQLLANDPLEDTGKTIAELIIQRQLEKMRYRENFQSKAENRIDEDEKW